MGTITTLTIPMEPTTTIRDSITILLRVTLVGLLLITVDITTIMMMFMTSLRTQTDVKMEDKLLEHVDNALASVSDNILEHSVRICHNAQLVLTISNARTEAHLLDLLVVANVFALKDTKEHIVSFRFHVLLDQADKPVSTEPSPASSETAVAHVHTDGKEPIAILQLIAQLDQTEEDVKTEVSQQALMEIVAVLVFSTSVESIAR